MIHAVVSRDVGFFSNVFSVLGALDCANDGDVTSIQFDTGPYLSSRSANWWGDFFEWTPHIVAARAEALNHTEAELRASELAIRLTPNRYRTGELIQKFIRVRPEILSQVETLWRELVPSGQFVVGVHVRGTDKYDEVGLVPLARVMATIEQAVRGRDPDSWKLFLATDEQRIWQTFRERFRKQLVAYQAVRSKNHIAVHSADARKAAANSDYGYQLGTDALKDVLSLARCDLFIGCHSNLSYAAAGWNPDMPWINLAPTIQLPNRPVIESLLAKEKVIQELHRAVLMQAKALEEKEEAIQRLNRLLPIGSRFGTSIGTIWKAPRWAANRIRKLALRLKRRHSF